MKIVELNSDDVASSEFYAFSKDEDNIWISPHQIDLTTGKVIAHATASWDGEAIPYCLRYTIDFNSERSSFPVISLYMWDNKGNQRLIIPESLLQYATRYVRYTINGGEYGYARLRVFLIPYLRVADMASGD